jgi:peptidoglycan biosynthesis protein MviN/MurJ (putative lipid II flippase)
LQSPPLDLASFIAAVLTVFVAPPLAHLMGVYTAIMIGAVFGAALGLMLARDEGQTSTRAGALLFITLMTGVSMVVTVGAAEIINKFLHLETISPLLAPVALVIAAVGRNWTRVAVAAWDFVKSRWGGAPRPDYGAADRRPQATGPAGRFRRPDEE